PTYAWERDGVSVISSTQKLLTFQITLTLTLSHEYVGEGTGARGSRIHTRIYLPHSSTRDDREIFAVALLTRTQLREGALGALVGGVDAKGFGEFAPGVLCVAGVGEQVAEVHVRVGVVA